MVLSGSVIFLGGYMGKIVKRQLTWKEIKEQSILGSLCHGCPKNLAVTGERQVQCSAREGMHVHVLWHQCAHKPAEDARGQAAA